MGFDTYYTVLGVPETATQAEIKAAYRNLIKKVHPDTVAALSPHLRRTAEDKTKELTEAYSVLSDVSKRRLYDRLLAEHRQPSAPRPTRPPQPSVRQSAAHRPEAGPYCCACGTPLYGIAFCRHCGTFVNTVSVPPPQPQRWKSTHPSLITLLCVLAVSSTFNSLISYSTQPAQSVAAVSSNPSVSNDSYSAFPCDRRYSVSPIDGKPCKPEQMTPPIGSEPEVERHR